MVAIWATYEADFYAVVICEVETSPVRRTHNVVWGVDYGVLDRFHMSERVSTNGSLEYLYDRICADLLTRAMDRLPMIDCVDEELFRVCG